MIAEVEIAHRLPGRLRLRVVARRGDSAFFEGFAAGLRQCPRVQSVEASPRTGSVLVYHDGTSEAIIAFGRTNDLFVAQPAPAPAEPPSTRAFELFRTLDTRLQQQTSGVWDLRELGFVLLSASGLFQAARRNVWPAGVSLLWYAAALVDRKRLDAAVNASFTRP
jgi:hypothetical protein